MVFLKPPADFAPKMRVSSCFLEVDGSFLVLHRQPWKTDPNKWSLPAGKGEQGETALETAIREVMEETGVDISQLDPEPCLTAFVRLKIGDIEYSVFRVHLPERPEIIPEATAHQAYRWVTPAEALKLPLIEDEDACIRMCYPAL